MQCVQRTQCATILSKAGYIKVAYTACDGIALQLCHSCVWRKCEVCDEFRLHYAAKYAAKVWYSVYLMVEECCHIAALCCINPPLPLADLIHVAAADAKCSVVLCTGSVQLIIDHLTSVHTHKNVL
jgi:hypothetical protein